jgi:HEAT repeat protein
MEDGLKDSPAIHNALMKIITSADLPAVQISAIKALQARKDEAALPAIKSLSTSSKDAGVRDAAKDAVEALQSK